MSCYQAFRIRRADAASGQPRAGIEALPLPIPRPGEVRVRVAYSSVNYKDALAGTGAAPILKTFPLTGGIDASGWVECSEHPAFAPGMAVIATGWGLGVDHDGGFAEALCVPGDWLVAMPEGLDCRRAMILGTAGFSAALAVSRLLRNDQRPELGPMLVTGASGGVGCIAVAILARLGFEVVAVSGKPERADWLRALGARRVIGRDGLAGGQRPLESALWGGAVDTVGGDTLARLTRTLVADGNIASIGMAAGVEFSTSVLPFILRGINLLGCNSVSVPPPLRRTLWQHLASDWRPPDLDAMLGATGRLDSLPDHFNRLLAGASHGRTLIEIGA